MTKLLLRALLAPFVIAAQMITLLVALIRAEAKHPVSQPPPFDYHQWQLDAARTKQLRNQEAYVRRQANKPKGFEASIAELRKLQGEDQ